MARSFVCTARGMLGMAVCTSLVVLAVSAAATLSLARAAELPLGVGSHKCDTVSAEFVGEKLGVAHVETAGQTLQSVAAPRTLSASGAVQAERPVVETPAAVVEETAPVAEAPVVEKQPPADAGTTVTEPSYTEPVVEEQPPVETAPVEEPVVEEQPPVVEEQPPVEQPPVESAPVEEQPPAEEPPADEPVYEEPAVEWYTAVASAYDPNCNGGTVTASGIPLDWSTPTVASPWIALGSYVEISYNGMTVVAQVTDRGPYIGGRDLDLAPGVFYAFGFDSADSWGVRTVSYRIL